MSDTNREILFRGKIIGEDKWVQWYYVCLNGKVHRIYTGYAETDIEGYYPDNYTVCPETVGQYTGLTDKNGTKIFEGDILDVSAYSLDGYGVVKFGEHKASDMSNDYPCGNLGFYIDFPDKKNQYVRKDILYFLAECEVIGNIHDNSELLK